MAWLSGWEYRKDITLARASGLVTNYQMKILVGESSGATGENVDCGGKCLSTFNDLRFTTSDGTTLLDYWIESISGTTPNKLATVWIEFDSIGTSDTQFYMYYGNTAASAVSNGANTFIAFDDFERGSDGDTIGGDWTESTAHVHISTEQKYAGSKSAKLIGGTEPVATYSITPTDNMSIQWRAYKENATNYLTFMIGNGTKRIAIYYGVSETIFYLNSAGAFSSSLGTATADTWHLFEINNIVWENGAFDLYVDGNKIGNICIGYGDSFAANVLFFRGSDTSNQDSWIDNVIIRNYRATEPAWGSWGAEEYDGSFTTESAVASATMDGITPIESTTESAEATDTFDGDSLRDSFTESAEASDTFGSEKTAYGVTTESAEAEDTMAYLHMVDSFTDSAVASDSMEAAEMIRKRIRFPNLQGKHLSLKFTSATDGSFAIYYLRHKMFKTRELCSDQKHPNTQGSHISVKLQNSGTDAFTLMYVSEEMQLVTT